MSLYLIRAQYTHQAFQQMLAKPGDREAPARELFDAAGVKLHHIWYSGEGEVICIAEGSPVSASTVSMVVKASGALAGVEITELITMKQQVEAMQGAAKVAEKYRPPGK